MKLHIPTSLLTLVIGSMSFAAAADYFEDTTLGDLTDVEDITVWGCKVEMDSVNGGSGVTVYGFSQRDGSTNKPATIKVNSNLMLKYSMLTGLDSSNVVKLIADEISSDGKLVFKYANLRALEGNITISGKRYEDDGFIAESSISNTDLIAEKGSVNIGSYLTMEGGTISAANSVNITNSTVTVNGLSAQAVNINEDGKLNIEDAGRVELGAVAVGAGASLGVNEATLVFNEESSITLAEGATLTAFDNVSFEFIIDADSITAGDGTYSFDVFAGIDNLTDEASISIIKEFEQALAAGEIDITLKGTDGELIDQDAGELNVSFTDNTITISGTVAAPEPTTATLSLLALAALAARRRRK